MITSRKQIIMSNLVQAKQAIEFAKCVVAEVTGEQTEVYNDAEKSIDELMNLTQKLNDTNIF